MPLGVMVSLYPGDIVLDGDTAHRTERGTASPLLGLCLLWPNGRPISATAEILFNFQGTVLRSTFYR